jgi:orotate phosphoribosyltransferase
MERYKEEFIEFLVQSEALKFGDFTTKSGRKTPFFINVGQFASGKQLNQLAAFYAQAIVEKFGKSFDILFGPAYKGIPLSVAVAMELERKFGVNVSYCSIRKEEKDHGDKGSFLGKKPTKGQKIVLIEDVTTAGTSIYETMPELEKIENIEVLGLVISVNRCEKGKTEKTALTELENAFNMKATSIVTMKEVIGYLYNKEVLGKIWIDDKLKKKIDEYYEKYGA